MLQGRKVLQQLHVSNRPVSRSCTTTYRFIVRQQGDDCQRDQIDAEHEEEDEHARPAVPPLRQAHFVQILPDLRLSATIAQGRSRHKSAAVTVGSTHDVVGPRRALYVRPTDLVVDLLFPLEGLEGGVCALGGRERDKGWKDELMEYVHRDR